MPSTSSNGIQPGVWATLGDWVRSLRPDDRRSTRDDLIQLRLEIIKYEIEKQRIIDIVEAHIHGGLGGGGVSDELRLSKIPDALVKIDKITKGLTRIAEDSPVCGGKLIQRPLGQFRCKTGGLAVYVGVGSQGARSKLRGDDNSCAGTQG